MQKYLKIIFINIFIILCIILIFEICQIFLYLPGDCIQNFNRYPEKNKLEIVCELINDKLRDYFRTYDLIYFYLDGFRQPAIYESSDISANKNHKRDIIVGGCSFTYGADIKNEESFHYVLSKYTKRNVYNFGIPGGSPREMLYILRNTDVLYKLIPKEGKPEYFIYTYINDHYKRLYSNYRGRVPVYVVKDNYTKLQFIDQPVFINRLRVNSLLFYTLFDLGFFKNNKKLYKLYMDEIYKELKIRFGDIKFVIFLYENDNSEIFKELEQEGIIVIRAKDILDVDIKELKYRVSDRNPHPSAKAWEVIVPALAKELNL